MRNERLDSGLPVGEGRQTKMAAKTDRQKEAGKLESGRLDSDPPVGEGRQTKMAAKTDRQKEAGKLESGRLDSDPIEFVTAAAFRP